jgi:hypothetical protein
MSIEFTPATVAGLDAVYGPAELLAAWVPDAI